MYEGNYKKETEADLPNIFPLNYRLIKIEEREDEVEVLNIPDVRNSEIFINSKIISKPANMGFIENANNLKPQVLNSHISYSSNSLYRATCSCNPKMVPNLNLNYSSTIKK